MGGGGNDRTASFTGCPLVSRIFSVHVLLSTAGGSKFEATMTNESPIGPLCVMFVMKSSARGSLAQPMLASLPAESAVLAGLLFDEQPPSPPSAAPIPAHSDSLMNQVTGRVRLCSAITKPLFSEG